MQHVYFGVFFTIWILFSVLTQLLHAVFTKAESNSNAVGKFDYLEELAALKSILLWGIPLLLFGYFAYVGIQALKLEAQAAEWLQLIVRWAHVVFGIAWIGASFYFIFLENSLNRTENLRQELAGNLWAVHGGGFYYLEKYKTAPETLPKKLHWFKYEAYFTWLSGMFLLLLVYYFNAKAMMIDTSVADISESTALGIGIGSLVLSWLIYDGLCRTKLLQNRQLFAIIGFCIVVLLAFGLSLWLSGRAAYMHVGVLLGTIMVGNVFFVIIPAQKAMVRAAKEGKPLDPEIGKYAGLRSLHNNYITFPVIFVMISNHFPMTFGSPSSWLILALLIIGSVAIRHFINLHEKGTYTPYLIPVGAVFLLAAIVISLPKKSEALINGDKVTYTQVASIFANRCTSCHGSNPTDDVYKTAPNGVVFESYEQIANLKDKILTRAVQTNSMPQGNKTNMLPEERALIGQWIEAGMPR